MTGIWYLSMLLAGSSVVSLAVAQMDLADDFRTQAARITVSGFGGKNQGSFAFAGHNGEFKRGESRLGIFDPLYVASKGKSSFSFREDGAADAIFVECLMKKGAARIGIISFDTKKMSYQCDFRQGTRLLGSRFVLGQPPADKLKEALLAKDTRVGEANILEQHLTIQSVHSYKGTKLQSAAPVGYVVVADGTTIAAVELTDINPTFYIAPDLNEALRRSALLTVLALAVLPDPANSALDN